MVELVGYGNQENVWLKELHCSDGEEACQKQTKEALGKDR